MAVLKLFRGRRPCFITNFRVRSDPFIRPFMTIRYPAYKVGFNFCTKALIDFSKGQCLFVFSNSNAICSSRACGFQYRVRIAITGNNRLYNFFLIYRRKILFFETRRFSFLVLNSNLIGCKKRTIISPFFFLLMTCSTSLLKRRFILKVLYNVLRDNFFFFFIDLCILKIRPQFKEFLFLRFLWRRRYLLRKKRRRRLFLALLSLALYDFDFRLYGTYRSCKNLSRRFLNERNFLIFSFCRFLANFVRR
jgi:hypothetical protein